MCQPRKSESDIPLIFKVVLQTRTFRSGSPSWIHSLSIFFMLYWKVQMSISSVSASRIRHQLSNFGDFTQTNRVFRCRCPPKNHQTRFFSKKGVKAKCEEEYFRKTQFTLLYFSDLHKSFANLIHRILATRTFRWVFDRKTLSQTDPKVFENVMFDHEFSVNPLLRSIPEEAPWRHVVTGFDVSAPWIWWTFVLDNYENYTTFAELAIRYRCEATTTVI